jgi:selenocysteine-specific elongation factor
LRLESPVTAIPGDRFIIRSYSPQLTIGGGVVIDALAPKHRRHDPALIVRLGRLEKASFPELVETLIESSGVRGTSRADLISRTGATEDQMSAATLELAAGRRIIEAPGSPPLFLSQVVYTGIAESMIGLLGEHHAREPLSLGMNREEVREKAARGLGPDVFRAISLRLCDERRIVAEKESLRLASHQPVLSDSDTAAKLALEAVFKASGWQALTLDEAAAAAGVGLERARALYQLLAAEHRLVRIGDLVFHTDVIEDLKSRIRARKAVNPRIDVAAFKEMTGGLTRKYAIPLLEYLDRERITRRVGNEREIL